MSHFSEKFPTITELSYKKVGKEVIKTTFSWKYSA